MSKQTAGILLYRRKKQKTEVFLVHPGGPFWKNKDLGAWSIPKGEFDIGEEKLAAARREFEEETGYAIDGTFLPLTPVKYKSGKIIYAWATEGDLDEESIRSNTFKLQWPLSSGKFIEVPEVDKAGWYDIETAKKKILPAQVSFIDELVRNLRDSLP